MAILYNLIANIWVERHKTQNLVASTYAARKLLDTLSQLYTCATSGGASFMGSDDILLPISACTFYRYPWYRYPW